MQSLKDLAFQRTDNYLNSSNKCIIFKHVLKNDARIQPDLNHGIAAEYKNVVSKFHLSAHSMNRDRKM